MAEGSDHSQERESVCVRERAWPPAIRCGGLAFAAWPSGVVPLWVAHAGQ